VRSITGDRETVIEHLWAVELAGLEALLGQARVAASDYGCHYLTLQVQPDQSDLRGLLDRLGFVLETERIVMPAADHAVPPGSPYAVRPLQEGDDFLIAVRNAQLLSHTLAAGRHYDVSELTFRSMEAMFEQLRRPPEAQQALVLTYHQREQVGHLILELGPEAGYVCDVAVEPQHWGGRAISLLMRAGSSWLHRHGRKRMVGDVSAANQRALKFAKRFLGFSVDSLRYGLSL
jgi:ribosomal protein S18 acetylase RimI-like enzyme